MRISVQDIPFDLGAETSRFTQAQTNMGAIVTFTGVVRDVSDQSLRAMEIEHYPGMTERALDAMAVTAIERFSLGDILIIHRHGRLTPGEVIMMVATAAKHRKDAFDGAEFLMDYLKSRAPFWKREITQNGADWVAARDADEAALDRWEKD
ncbi:MAG: molybdenum cofactor biosynthesis protein MoaE [Sulfitobacter sp.]